VRFGQRLQTDVATFEDEWLKHAQRHLRRERPPGR
jgi:hypothetical protein